MAVRVVAGPAEGEERCSRNAPHAETSGRGGLPEPPRPTPLCVDLRPSPPAACGRKRVVQTVRGVRGPALFCLFCFF